MIAAFEVPRVPATPPNEPASDSPASSGSPPLPDADARLDGYRFDLPERLIAQEPGPRGASRLLVLDRSAGRPRHARFADLPSLLPPGALLVANNSRVVPARLLGKRPTGGKMELLLLTPLPLLEPAGSLGGNAARPRGGQAEAEVLLKPAKAMRPGLRLCFAPEPDPQSTESARPEDILHVTVLEQGGFGRHRVRLEWEGSLRGLFERRGRLPLPPYIRREDTADDAERYQTVFARADKAGSVAAPTAGLHFTPALHAALAKAGCTWAELTLHVGYGTFSPVRCADLREHEMHSEFVELPEATARAVREARRAGRPVVAVGTTACRTLEGLAQAQDCEGADLAAGSGWTRIFIRPGYRFRVVDGLITNFHLPESTLLMLVSALVGRERLLAAYAEAVEREYRFFSYGDAMFLRPA